MAAALLTSDTLRLSNLPTWGDISTLANLLTPARRRAVHLKRPLLGPTATAAGVLEIATPKIASTVAPYDLVRKMRASVLVLGPLLARARASAEVSLPGGLRHRGPARSTCTWRASSAWAPRSSWDGGYVRASAPKGLRGGEIVFPKVSVGATENLMMAACLGRGARPCSSTPRREPEIVDLAELLTRMGRPASRVPGGERIRIQGGRGAERHHPPTGGARPHRGRHLRHGRGDHPTGDLHLLGAKAAHLPAVIETLEKAGVALEENQPGPARAPGANGRLLGTDMMTEAFPGFPTDLQAQFMALMTTAEGAAMVTETIFENRFMHVPELSRLGADIVVHGASALVRGRDSRCSARR